MDERTAVIQSRTVLLVAIACLWGVVAAQRPLTPPNYYLFELIELVPGEPLTAQLTTTDGQNFKDGSHLDLYTINGRAGEQVSLRVSSTEFDPYVTLFDPTGRPLAMNDDLSGSVDAGVDFGLPSDGRYLVVVSGYSQFDLGSYKVTLQLAGSVENEARSLDLPATVSSHLTVDMPTITDTWLGPTEYYRFEVTDPVLLVAAMSSSEFDTVLTLYDADLNQITQNDDDELTSDSQLFARLEPGLYLLAASSYFTDSTGSYELIVETYVPSE